jgi:hypothetical protein
MRSVAGLFDPISFFEGTNAGVLPLVEFFRFFLRILADPDSRFRISLREELNRVPTRGVGTRGKSPRSTKINKKERLS